MATVAAAIHRTFFRSHRMLQKAADRMMPNRPTAAVLHM